MATKVLFVQPNAGWKWDSLEKVCVENNAALCYATNCKEAEFIIRTTYPEVVVSAVNLMDGDWKRVLNLVSDGRMACNVIVVSQHDDIPLYLEAMENGAYDFATLYTSSGDLSWILRCAISNAKLHREVPKAAAA